MRLEVYLKKGAPIVCPKCFKAVLKLSMDVYEGDYMKAHQLALNEEYVGKYDLPQEGDLIMCLACKEEFWHIVRFNPMEGVFRKKDESQDH